MTSILSQGKYRQRRDWSTNSIPELVSLEEESSSPVSESPPPLPPKPRRSSLAIGLLGGRGLIDKNYKRRSSIAVTFLGRQNKVKFYSQFIVNFYIPITPITYNIICRFYLFSFFALQFPNFIIIYFSIHGHTS